MAAARTAKQKAALRKAQLASAKKRKRHAVVRNAGRGVIGSKRGSNKRKYRLIRAGAGLAAAGAVAYGVHKLNGRKTSMKAPKTDHAAKKKRTGRPEGKSKVVYHHTTKENAAAIEKHGLRGSKAHDNRAYVSDKPMRGHRYGSHVVKLRVNRHKLRRDVIGGKKGEKYYSIHNHHLKDTKATSHTVKKKRARVRSNPYR